ncbi:unnamed protein product [Tilletia laevis]|uniref:Uncharacterized protein n=1 Tax=Tilletia laevis TaxID=157183 RepID=A0A9N8QLP5_9BASI|nr:unnamed protein product [Tilletia laevis]
MAIRRQQGHGLPLVPTSSKSFGARRVGKVQHRREWEVRNAVHGGDVWTVWRSAPGMKQEWSRRRKVIELIEEITRSRPAWKQEHALRFFGACYGGYSARGLSEWLSKTSGFKRKRADVDHGRHQQDATSARDVIMGRLRTWLP